VPTPVKAPNSSMIGPPFSSIRTSSGRHPREADRRCSPKGEVRDTKLRPVHPRLRPAGPAISSSSVGSTVVTPLPVLNIALRFNHRMTVATATKTTGSRLCVRPGRPVYLEMYRPKAEPVHRSAVLPDDYCCKRNHAAHRSAAPLDTCQREVPGVR
jgi:hypothetical protein